MIVLPSLSYQRSKKQCGFTLIEMVASLIILAVITKLAVSQMQEYNDNAKFSANQVVSFFKEARAKALASTQAYTLEPSGTGMIISKYSPLCSSATKTTDGSFSLKLSSGTTLYTTGWSICYNSRGFASSNLSISVRDRYGSLRTIETVLGGATRLL